MVRRDADVYVIDVDMMTSVADAGTNVEYNDAAMKHEHVVVTIDKKALEIPAGMSLLLNYYSLEAFLHVHGYALISVCIEMKVVGRGCMYVGRGR